MSEASQERFHPHSPDNPRWQLQWEAYDRMVTAASDDEFFAVYEVTSLDDPGLIANFRTKFEEHLTPESILFLKLSELAKREWMDHYSNPVDKI